MTRRRRGLLLLGLALVLGGLAASDVASREAALERRLGPLTPVVVARQPLPAGEPIDPARLAVRSVPARFAPRGTFATTAQVVGQTPAAPIPAGADVSAASLQVQPAGAPVARGERVAEIVATGSPDHVVAGARVDVLVTREGQPGAPARTALALEDVEVLDAAPAPASEQRHTAQVRASLRVSLRQAVFLAAAQSFARELRLLPRAEGDRARHGAGVAYGGDLG